MRISPKLLSTAAALLAGLVIGGATSRIASVRGRETGYNEAMSQVARHVADGTLFKEIGPIPMTSDFSVSNLMVIQVIYCGAAIDVSGAGSYKISANQINMHRLLHE